jgi:protein involved in plasmid replication-relaxation
MQKAVTKKAALTERDTQVVLDLYKYRYLSVSQIQLLHFPSLQTAYRRLRALTELAYVKGFTVPGIPEHLYHLDNSGAELVAEQLGVGVSDLKWNRPSRAPKDYYFLRHFLKTNDFRIALTLACRGSNIDLLGFIPEYYGEKSSQGSPVKYIKDFICDIRDARAKITHTPDAVFALSKKGTPALFFLEIDRGTEVVSDQEKGVLKSVRFYLNYLISGKYQRYQEDFGCGGFKGFRTLIVTTSASRIENMRQAISNFDFAEKAKKFIWLTTDKRIQPATMFQPIWVCADRADQTEYRIG